MEPLYWAWDVINSLWPAIVVLSVFAGFLGLFFAFTLRPRGKIHCLLQNEINLANDISSNFSTLEILHNGRPTSENLYYVRGHLINTGNIDIDESMVYAPLALEAVKTSDSIIEVITDKALQSFPIQADELTFRFKLMKTMEYCTFEALIKSDKDQSRKQLVRLAGRIKNTKLSTGDMIQSALRLKGIRQWLISIAMVPIGVLTIVGSLHFLTRESYDTFMLFDKTYREYVYLTEADNEFFRVNAIGGPGGPPDGPRNELIRKSELLEGERFRFIPDANRFAWLPYPMLVASGVFVMIVAVIAIFQTIRYRKIPDVNFRLNSAFRRRRD